MSDFNYLNQRRVREGQFGSDESYGFNGLFVLMALDTQVRIIASDGEGWQHVSVSIVGRPNKTPSWDVMCFVKALFWEPQDCVIQFHPPESEYVNHHPGCLHLWRCTDGREQPMPPSILVGPK